MDINLEEYVQKLEQQVSMMNRQIVLQMITIENLQKELAKYAPDAATDGSTEGIAQEENARNGRREGIAGDILSGK